MTMNRTFFAAVLVCGAAWVAVGLQTATADVIVAQHSGMTNPTTEGWAKVDVGSGAVCAGYDDGGTLMWEVSSTHANGSMYVQDASTAELSDMQTYGWNMVASVKVPEYSKTPDYSRAIIVDDGIRDYYLKFGTDTADQRVQWEGGANAGFATLTGGYAYHTYEIRVAPGAGSASVYADGNLLVSGWTGYNTGEAHNVFFGNVGSSAGTCDFAHVTLTYAVPEPSAVMLLISGLLGLLCYAWRRRK
jgi:hypothetical protein